MDCFVSVRKIGGVGVWLSFLVLIAFSFPVVRYNSCIFSFSLGTTQVWTAELSSTGTPFGPSHGTPSDVESLLSGGIVGSNGRSTKGLEEDVRNSLLDAGNAPTEEEIITLRERRKYGSRRIVTSPYESCLAKGTNVKVVRTPSREPNDTIDAEHVFPGLLSVHTDNVDGTSSPVPFEVGVTTVETLL